MSDSSDAFSETSANVIFNSHIRLRESFLKLWLKLRNNVYVFPTGKYTSGSSNSPTWRKRNPQAKPFSKFKTTTQVTDRNGYNSAFLGELACLCPPRKCKSACKTSSVKTCKILIDAE